MFSSCEKVKCKLTTEAQILGSVLINTESRLLNFLNFPKKELACTLFDIIDRALVCIETPWNHAQHNTSHKAALNLIYDVL